MSQPWIRRSSSLARLSHESKRNTGSRIPLALGSGIKEPGGLKRSKSTLCFTPQESSGYRTPQRNLATPLQFGSYSGIKTGFQKDLRNIQDKQFQRDATAKVINYLKANCPSLLINNDIRPMTIKLFTELLSYFFATLGIYNQDNLVQFTTSNYEKDVIYWMRLMEYPGSVSKSWLTIVNAPQCYPHVIALLSWLVSLVQLPSLFDPEIIFSEDQYHDPQKKFDIVYFKICIQAHKNIERVEEISQEIPQYAAQIFGVTDEDLDKIKAENDALKQQLDDPELKALRDKHDELEQHVKLARDQKSQDQKKIEALKERIEKLKAEAAKKERHISASKYDLQKAKTKLEELKSEVQTQAISMTEYTELMRKCDYLKKEISFTEKECEDHEKLIARYDDEVAIKRDKILQNASNFNRRIIQLEQQIPELKGLRARSNPESAEVLDDVEGLLFSLKEVKNRLMLEYENLEVVAKERHNQVEVLRERLRTLNNEERLLREKLAETKGETDRITNEIAEKRQKWKESIENMERQLQAVKKQEEDNQKVFEILAERKRRYESLQILEKKIEERQEMLWKILEDELKKHLEEKNEIKEKVSELNSDMVEQLKTFKDDLRNRN